MSEKKKLWLNEYRIVSSAAHSATWHDAVEEINYYLYKGWYCWGDPVVVGTEFIQAMMKTSEIKEENR